MGKARRPTCEHGVLVLVPRPGADREEEAPYRRRDQHLGELRGLREGREMHWVAGSGRSPPRCRGLGLLADYFLLAPAAARDAAGLTRAESELESSPMRAPRTATRGASLPILKRAGTTTRRATARGGRDFCRAGRVLAAGGPPAPHAIPRGGAGGGAPRSVTPPAGRGATGARPPLRVVDRDPSARRVAARPVRRAPRPPTRMPLTPLSPLSVRVGAKMTIGEGRGSNNADAAARMWCPVFSGVQKSSFTLPTATMSIVSAKRCGESPTPVDDSASLPSHVPGPP